MRAVSRHAAALGEATRRVGAAEGRQPEEEWALGACGLLADLEEMQAQQAAFIAAARRIVATVSTEPPSGPRPAAGLDLAAAVSDYERSLVLWALARAGGQQLEAARLLGVRTSTLNEKMKRLAIRRPCEAQATAEPHEVISMRGRRGPST